MPSWQQPKNRLKTLRTYIIHPMKRSLLLCSWLVDEFARFQFVKTKAYKNAFYQYVYIPTFAHWGFRYGDTQQRYEKYFNVNSTNSRYLYCVWENNKAISWRAYCISWPNKDIELSARDGTFLGRILSEKGFDLKKVDRIRSAALVLRAALLIRYLTKKWIYASASSFCIRR